MTAAYKIALAAGATLLLIVIASLILSSDNAPADPDTIGGEDGGVTLGGDDPNAIELLPSDPPADPPPNDLGRELGLAYDPDGPPTRESDLPDPSPTRVNYPDLPDVVTPVDPEPNSTMTVGRDPFRENDPFGGTAFEPLDEPLGNATPEPVAEGGLPTQDDPTLPTANRGISLGPLDSPASAPGNSTQEATPTPPTPPPAPPILRLYTIEAGDSLSSVALATYGSATQWVDIAQANPLVDPNRLKVGQEIKLPDLTGKGPDQTTPAIPKDDDLPRKGATYTVKAGDNLSNIAKQFYNSTAKWELVFQANRRTIGDDPGNLKVGMELLIPPPDTGAN